MRPQWLVRSLSMIAMAALLLMRPACAADIHVMISSGFHGAYTELVPAFERATGHHLVTTRGPSMGDSPEAIPVRLARGEAADVVILDGGAADELGKRGLVRGGSKVELARSLVGMVVREGTPKPDIGSVEALRRTLLAAKSIAYSDSGSGTYLSTTLFGELGVADEIAPKSRTAVGRAGRRCGRAGRSRDRLPAGQRTDPCAGRYLRWRASPRSPAHVLVRRRADQ
jgi:molybdate transport system substrate-binding protein